MRRTVKAWMVRSSLREQMSSSWWGIAFGARTSAITETKRVPITITWDDGRPAPKRRTRTARKGREGGKRG